MSQEIRRNNSKRKYEICPACHQNSLVIHVETKAKPDSPYLKEKWLCVDCQNCDYSKEPKRLEKDVFTD